MLLSEGKKEIIQKTYECKQFFGNEAMAGYWNNPDLRDKNARTRENTYMHGRFSVEVTGGSDSWWSWFFPEPNGTWYCYMTRAGAIASGTKLDTES